MLIILETSPSVLSPRVFVKHVDGGEFLYSDEEHERQFHLLEKSWEETYASVPYILTPPRPTKDSIVPKPTLSKNLGTMKSWKGPPLDKSYSTTWYHLSTISRKSHIVETSALAKQQRVALDGITAPVPQTIDQAGSQDPELDRNIDMSEILSRIYRSHQPISLLEDDSWAVGAQSRFTCHRSEKHGFKIVLYMFDSFRSATFRRFDEKVSKYLQEPMPIFSGQSERAKREMLGLPSSNTDVLAIDERRLLPRSCSRLYFCGLIGLGLSDPDSTDLYFIKAIAFDWSNVFSKMSDTLERVDRGMADTVILQREVNAWQGMLCAWRPLTANAKANIKETLTRLHYLQKTNKSTPPDSQLLEQAEICIEMYEDLLQDIDSIAERSEKSFQALMSSMSIRESQKAIDEAASVSRLTELAFIFIPISFAATFFNMSIDSLNPTLGKFFGLSIVLLAAAYGCRLAVRSQTRQNMAEKLRVKVLRTSNLSEGVKVSNSTAAVYGWTTIVHVFRNMGFFPRTIFFISSLSALTTSLTFTQSHNHRFQIASVVVTFTIGLIYAIYAAATNHNKEDWIHIEDLIGVPTDIIQWIYWRIFAGPKKQSHHSKMKQARAGDDTKALKYAVWLMGPKQHFASLVSLGCIYGAFAVGFETTLAPALKILIICIFEIIAHMVCGWSEFLLLIPWQLKLLLVWICKAAFVLVATSLLWFPWSHNPHLTRWKPILITSFLICLISQLSVALPTSFKVFQHTRSRNPDPDWEKRKDFYTPGMKVSFIIESAVLIATFPIIMWFGQIHAFDLLSNGSKAGITAGYLVFLALICGTVVLYLRVSGHRPSLRRFMKEETHRIATHFTPQEVALAHEEWIRPQRNASSTVASMTAT